MTTAQPKIIIVKNPDGSCGIIYPVPNMFDPSSRDRLELADKQILALDATEDEVLAFVIFRSNLDNKDYRIADRSALPADRTFRNAWTDDKPTPTVDVDITKAKEIHKNRLRELRKPKLEALDIQFMQALEQGQDTKAITAQKQVLRDVTKLKMPAKPDALKDFIPDCLKD